jgi:hypothetical protein
LKYPVAFQEVVRLTGWIDISFPIAELHKPEVATQTGRFVLQIPKFPRELFFSQAQKRTKNLRKRHECVGFVQIEWNILSVPLQKTKQIELSWVELNWIELSWIGLNWVELSWGPNLSVPTGFPRMKGLLRPMVQGIFPTNRRGMPRVAIPQSIF